MLMKVKFRLPTYLDILIVSIISFLCLVLLYWPGLQGPFLLDDLPSIEPAKLDSFSWAALLEISTQNESGPLGRPLSILSFALNHYFFGPEPFSYKVVNVILHFTAGWILAWFSYLLMTAYRPKLRYKVSISCIIAFIWLIHPLHISTVLYTVQRMTILSQLFTLLACSLYVYARLKQRCQYPYLKWFYLSGLCWLLGLASKEIAVLLPFYLFVIEYFILKFRLSNRNNSELFYRYAKLFILTSVLLSLLTYWYCQDHFQLIFAEKPFSIVERIFTEINALVFYIRLTYLPVLSDMSLYHDDFLIVHSINSEFLISCLILTFLITSIFLFQKRSPFIAFGLAWFFISHLLESTVLPLELVFEHRNYLASFGLILIPVMFVAQLMQKRRAVIYKTHLVLGVLFIVLLMSMTWARAEQWSTIEKFLQAALSDKPNSARTHIEYANWLLKQGAYVQAYSELLRAQEIQPHNTGIDLHILLIHCHAEFVPTSVYESVERKIKRYPITPYVILGLDQIIQNLFDQQCNAINKDKVRNLIQAAYQNPFLVQHPRYQSILYHLEAGLMMIKDNKNDAKLLLMRSYKAYPKRMDSLVAKAILELNQGDIKSARESIQILTANKSKFYAPKSKIEELEKLIDDYQE